MEKSRSSVALRRLSCAAVSLAFAISSGGALAEQASAYAHLTQVKGTVLVDRGTGFVPATGSTGLELGDRVMVADGGGALLDFGNNCSLPLKAPSMMTVRETACTVTTQGTGGRFFGPLLLIAGSAAAAGGIYYLTTRSNNSQEQVSP